MKTATIFKRWNQVRSGLLEALGKLSDDQLGFTPRQDLWSLGETVFHIADTEESWLRFFAMNKWFENKQTAADFPTIDSLKSLLAQTHATTEKQFSENPDNLMKTLCPLPWGNEVTMEWVVWHVLEHEIHHRGEIYLMLGLMGMEAPDV